MNSLAVNEKCVVESWHYLCAFGRGLALEALVVQRLHWFVAVP